MHPVQVEEGLQPVRGLIQVAQGIVPGAAADCDDLLFDAADFDASPSQ